MIKQRLLYYPLSLIILMFSLPTHAQNVRVDSMLNIIQLEETNDSVKAQTYLNIADKIYREDYELALNYCDSALFIAESQKFPKIESRAYRVKGNSYWFKNKSALATNCQLKALKIAEEINDNTQISHACNNLSIIYKEQGMLKESLEFSKRDLEILLKQEEYYWAAISYNNLGLTYKELKQYEDALIQFDEALFVLKENNLLEEFRYLGRIYNNKGLVFLQLEEFYDALKHFDKAIKEYQKHGEQQYLAHAYNNIGRTYLQIGQDHISKDYLNKGLELAKKLEIKDIMMESHLHLALLGQNMNDWKSAYKHYRAYHDLNSEIFDQKSKEHITSLTKKYESDRKEKENILLRSQKKLQEEQLARKKTELRVQQSLSAIAILCIIFLSTVAFLQFKKSRQRSKINYILKQKNDRIETQKNKLNIKTAQLEQINEEIKTHSEALENALHEIERKNTDLMDSLDFAQTIQQAVLPQKASLRKFLPEFFIFDRPVSTVSGDFYWAEKIGNLLYLAVADCTGHGVPGAFMSLMGMNALTEIILQSEKPTSAKEILVSLNKKIRKALHQESTDHEQVSSILDQGMDIALCIIDTDNQSITFSGARRPIVLAKGKEIETVKGSRVSIGEKFSEDSLQETIYQYKDGCMLYLFSDGYQDQFGGPLGKKFMIKRFKELLQKMNPLSIQDQKASIADQLSNWQGNTPQVDDILVFGIRL